MGNTYLTSKKGLEDTIELIEEQVKDLDYYSLYNDGVLDEDIIEIKSILKTIQKKGEVRENE